MASDGSTFAPALRLLPDEARADVYCLYQVLRSLDDLVDDRQPQAEQRIEAVERWARGEQADTYETRVLDDLSERHTLPRQAFLGFCQGKDSSVINTPCSREESRLGRESNLASLVSQVGVRQEGIHQPS